MTGNRNTTPIKSGNQTVPGFFYAVVVVLIILLSCFFISYTHFVAAYALPSPRAVLKSFGEEIVTGRLINDIIASLWRVAIGFVISAALGIPAGLWLGQHLRGRQAFVPLLNFFRFLSPLAWIPFAILWFHIGENGLQGRQFRGKFWRIAFSKRDRNWERYNH